MELTSYDLLHNDSGGGLWPEPEADKAAPKTFRVKKATFTVKGTVTAIKLGR